MAAAAAPAAAPATAAGVNPDHVREVVSEVLSDPAYDLPDQPLLLRLLDAVLDAIGRLLATGGAAAGFLASLVLLAMLLVLAGLALWFLRGVRDDGRLGGPLAGPVGRSAREWAAEAAQHEAAGRFREAIRARYRQSLAELAGAGLLDDVPGQTTGQVAAAVSAAAPAVAAPWRELTAIFERAWYGRARLGGDDLAAVAGAQARVRAESRRHAGARG